jgi:homopolymeric O-antigen transport system permease protein
MEPATTTGATYERHALEDPAVRVIKPAKRRLRPLDVIRHGSVIRILAIRDFKAKYKQSLLGPAWLIFQPVALLLAFLIAFRGLGKVQSAHVPYVVFTLAGLATWSFFQAAMTIGTSSVITNSAFVRFTPCPRIAFPVAAVIASLPSFAVTAIGAIVAALATGYISPRVFLLPVMLAWLVLLTAGLVGVSAALAVRYRDMISALPFLLQLGVFLAPVGFALSNLSPAVRTIVELNPLTGVIEGSRWAVIAGYHPSVLAIAIALGMTAALVALGWFVFTRFEPTMADVI